jgi:hypothetical protein
MGVDGIDRGLVKRWLAIRSVPSSIVVLTAIASYSGMILGNLQAWPLWGIALAALLPWIPLFTAEIVWTYRHYHWLALFYVLVVTQGGHFLEHVVQMVQIHMLGLKGLAARGVFGALDIEWVHFIWNTWVLVVVLLLLYRFRKNAWLWATVVLAGWHELEHIVIMAGYLRTHIPGGPGLLARGGLIGGGLPLTRPDLHFLYNLIETTPLVIAFAYQLKDTYDAWVKRAFPHLSEELLIKTTAQLQLLRFAEDQKIIRQGEAPDRLYIITRGEAVVTRSDDASREIPVATLSAGQFFGEIGLLSMSPRTASVSAKTPVEVLALDRTTFQRLVANSEATAEDIARVARSRLSRTAD